MYYWKISCFWIACFSFITQVIPCDVDGRIIYEEPCFKIVLSDSPFRLAVDNCTASRRNIIAHSVQQLFWEHNDAIPASDKELLKSLTCFYIQGESLKETCENDYNFVCTKNSEQLPTDVGCPEGRVMYASACFFYTQTPLMTHHEAVQYCQRNADALANMTDSRKFLFAETAAMQKGSKFWVGSTEQEMKECMMVTYGETEAEVVWNRCSDNDTAHPMCESKPIILRIAVTTSKPPENSSVLSMSSTLDMHTTTEEHIIACPEGRNWRDRSDTCYWETTYETRLKSWDEAREFCNKLGGDLASYSDITEERFAIGNAWGHERGLWMGLRRYPPDNDFRWTDGTPLRYSRWARGQPNQSSQTKFCVANMGNNSNWELSYCGTRRWFVCEAPKAIHPEEGQHVYDESEDEEVADTICQHKSRWRNSAYFFQEHCYFVETTNTYSWETARLFCADQGAHLLSVHSLEETDFLLSIMRGSRKFWTGLTSRGLRSSFTWSDGSPLEFVFWDEDEEMPLVKDMDICVSLDKSSGYWSAERCNSLLHVICKREVNEIVTTPRPTTPMVLPGFCADGWYEFGNNCYKPFGYKLADKATWTVAWNKCLEIGATLPSVHSQAEQDFLSELVLEIGFNTWIGLYAIIRSTLFQWTDNSTIDFTYWNEDEPYHNDADEDCVEMIYDAENMGKWNDIICGKPKGYVCKRPKDISLNKPGVEPRTCEKPEGWSRLGPSCYSVFQGFKSTETWLNAQAHCRKFGAHLTTINNYGATIFLKNLIDKEKSGTGLPQSSAFWIGAREREENTYAWLIDYPLTYTNWLLGQPQEVSRRSNCVATTWEGGWIVRDCNEKHAFICEYESSTGRVSSSLKDEIIQSTCPNSTFEWHDIPGNYCYWFEMIDRQPWSQAMHKCFERGGFLGSFHSKEQLNYIAPFIKNHPWPLHIGLGQRHDGTFAWVDGSPIDFVNWQDGEPNAPDEKCVEMHTDVLTWNDIMCSEPRGYICSVHKVPVNDSALYGQIDDGANASLAIGGIVGIVICVFVILAIIAVTSYYLCPSTKYRAKRLCEPDTL